MKNDSYFFIKELSLKLNTRIYKNNTYKQSHPYVYILNKCVLMCACVCLYVFVYVCVYVYDSVWM